MTTREAANELGITIKHVMTLIYEKKLKARLNSKGRWNVSTASVAARKNGKK